MSEAAHRRYATVEDGVNYRLIADTMTILGHPMNHSSARNNVVRVMEKFIRAISENWNVQFTEDEIAAISRSPSFHEGISSILSNCWDEGVEGSPEG